MISSGSSVNVVSVAIAIGAFLFGAAISALTQSVIPIVVTALIVFLLAPAPKSRRRSISAPSPRASPPSRRSPPTRYRSTLMR